MATPRSVPCAHPRCPATSVRRRPASDHVHRQRCPLATCVGAGPKRRTTNRRTGAGRIGISASTSFGCAAAAAAGGRGGRRLGCCRAVGRACTLGAVGETRPRFESMLLMASVVTAPIRSTQPAVAAAKRSDRRSPAGWSWASTRARRGGSDVGIVGLWSARSGATRAAQGSGSRFRACAASSGSTSASSGLIGPGSRRPRCEGASTRLASSAPKGSIGAREEGAGMRTLRPDRLRREAGAILPLSSLDVSAKCRPLRRRSGESKRRTDARR